MLNMIRKLFIGFVICLLSFSMVGCVLAHDSSYTDVPPWACNDHEGNLHLEKRILDDFGEGDNFIPTKPSDYIIDVDPSHYDDEGGHLEKTIW